MKLALKYIKKIAIVMFFVSFLFVCKRIGDYIFAVDGYSCNFDNLISCEHKGKIFNFINLNQELKTCSIENISKKIQENFCVIKNIEVFHAANGIVSLNICSNEPKFILNKDYVLAENKQIFDKSLFSEKALKGCNPVLLGCIDFRTKDSVNCEIKSDLISNNFQKEVEDSCKNMLFSLPQKYFQEYEIIRESCEKSYMIDKINKNFIILFNDFLAPDDRLLAYCLYIKNELQVRGEFNRKMPKNWVADIRFKDQIVVGN